jgi:hypothetical protein
LDFILPEMNSITFQIPANDEQLAEQVHVHVSNHEEEVDMTKFLSNIAKKYRFAGYIGTIDFLFEEVKNLKVELELTRVELEKVKKQKRPWLF